MDDGTQRVWRLAAEPTTAYITGTKCHPDIVAVQKPRLRPNNVNKGQTNGNGTHIADMIPIDANPTNTSAPANAPKPAFNWVELETVVAYHSKGKSEPDHINQVIAYTGYLLAARPDRVVALGLYIKPDGFVAVLADPTRVYRTETIQREDPLAKQLLFRVLYYIDRPPSLMIDPTIQRDVDCTFQITLDGNVHNRYQQCCSPILGRWTTIFKKEQSGTDPSPGPGPIFKYQYLRAPDITPDNDPDIPEGKILKHIHQPEEIPGVVRMESYGWVKRAGGDVVACSTGNRRRQRAWVKLVDEGGPFMGINKPRDALIASWDLLEGDTFLYL
jgi:hypothetical protein